MAVEKPLCAHCGQNRVARASALTCSQACGFAFRTARVRAEKRVAATPPPDVPGAAWLHVSSKRISVNFALVDTDLASELQRYSWSAMGDAVHGWYAATTIGGKKIRLHQLVLPSADSVDHRNGDTFDCRRQNLRASTLSQNAANRKKIASTSPYKGIRSTRGGWEARIKVKGRAMQIGTFDTAEQAARAYDAAARQAFGEFACVNFPDEGERGALQ
jgi:hypothetical protein